MLDDTSAIMFGGDTPDGESNKGYIINFSKQSIVRVLMHSQLCSTYFFLEYIVVAYY